jgi:hypothetical protein
MTISEFFAQVSLLALFLALENPSLPLTYTHHFSASHLLLCTSSGIVCAVYAACTIFVRTLSYMIMEFYQH